MGRDKNNPIFAAITSVHIENNIWKAWYNSGLSWTKKMICGIQLMEYTTPHPKME